MSQLDEKIEKHKNNGAALIKELIEARKANLADGRKIEARLKSLGHRIRKRNKAKPKSPSSATAKTVSKATKGTT